MHSFFVDTIATFSSTFKRFWKFRSNKINTVGDNSKSLIDFAKTQLMKHLKTIIDVSLIEFLQNQFKVVIVCLIFRTIKTVQRHQLNNFRFQPLWTVY